jgi:hypothetical protein
MPNILKKNVVLDLDNTLICAEAIEEFPFTNKGIKENSLKFAIHNLDNIYIVFERPYLQEFLDRLFEEYNVSIWTAATKEYALFIIKNIICPIGKRRKRKLKWIFWDYHGEISYKKYNHPKNLKLLWNDFKLDNFYSDNTIIIDDYKNVIKKQKKNSIRVIPPFNILNSTKNNFNEKSMKDIFLQEIFTTIETKFKKLKKE